MTSNILPYVRRSLPGFLSDSIPHMTRSTSKIIEIFNNCLRNSRLISTQTLLNPQALLKVKCYYITRENMLAASDEPDYAIGSERDEYLTFLNHCGQEINPNVQGVLTDFHLITYLKANQIRPII